MPDPQPFTVLLADERTQLATFVDHYRVSIDATLDGLTEEEARRRLVPSRTTLLGLVKHVTFMDAVWFIETLTGTHRSDLGLPLDSADSFLVTDDDTIAGVLAAHQAVCERSRRHAADLALDHVAISQRVGEVNLRWIYLQALRELAHHSGHADILREQILAARAE